MISTGSRVRSSRRRPCGSRRLIGLLRLASSEDAAVVASRIFGDCSAAGASLAARCHRRSDDALEGELHLVAGRALGSVGPSAILFGAEPIEIGLLQVDELDGLAKLTAERVGLRLQLGDPTARGIEFDSKGVALRACRRIQDSARRTIVRLRARMS